MLGEYSLSSIHSVQIYLGLPLTSHHDTWQK